MTRDEIMTLGFEELEERVNAIAVETAEADKDQLETLNAELDAIEERKKALNIEIEERKKAAEAVAHGAGTEIEERKEKKMTDRETRSTPEYIDAYAELVKKGYDLDKVGAEKRATLLSANASGGTIAVPTFVEDRISTAWENNEIMSRVRKTYLRGNVQVGVEVSASAAEIHEEGGSAIASENLDIQFVNLVAEYVKKLIEVSHTALEMGPREFLDYLYDELEYQIVKKCAAEVILKVVNSAFHTEMQIAGNSLATSDIIEAEGRLSGDAYPVLVISRAKAAALKAAALSANYGYDPFDGLEVIYNDYINSNGEALVIDLNAVMCNFPDGDQPKFIFDEFTMADRNIVRIIGRLAMASDLVRTGAAVLIKSGGEE